MTSERGFTVDGMQCAVSAVPAGPRHAERSLRGDGARVIAHPPRRIPVQTRPYRCCRSSRSGITSRRCARRSASSVSVTFRGRCPPGPYALHAKRSPAIPRRCPYPRSTGGRSTIRPNHRRNQGAPTQATASSGGRGEAAAPRTRGFRRQRVGTPHPSRPLPIDASPPELTVPLFAHGDLVAARTPLDHSRRCVRASNGHSRSATRQRTAAAQTGWPRWTALSVRSQRGAVSSATHSRSPTSPRGAARWRGASPESPTR